jgi:hypothetical protein
MIGENGVEMERQKFFNRIDHLKFLACLRSTPQITNSRLRDFVISVCGLAILFFSGCATPAETAGVIAGSIAAATVTGARSPSTEIEQVYYLGVFDPQEQVPPQVYRIRVHGQASAISGVKFGSGWVPASIIDSLSGSVHMDVNAAGTGLTISKDNETLASLQTGRRMIQFGPEGFREAPKDHRLVIVMGSSPKAYFEAVDEALGQIAKLQIETGSAELRQKLFQAFLQAELDQERLSNAEAQTQVNFKE